jgi:hypothetical protein
MSGWTQTDWRIGMWSAMGAATIGFIFVVVGLIGVVARPPSPEPLHQVDPYLAILETLDPFRRCAGHYDGSGVRLRTRTQDLLSCGSGLCHLLLRNNLQCAFR